MSKSQIGIHPIYAIVADDRFLLTGALEQVLAALAPETDVLGPAQFDGSSATLADVLDEVRTPSLLGNRRVVIVDDAEAFIRRGDDGGDDGDDDKPRSQAANASTARSPTDPRAAGRAGVGHRCGRLKTYRELLEAYAADPSPTGSLILLCRTLPKTTRLYKAIDAVGLVIKIEAPEGRAVIPWIVSRARDEYAKRMSSAAAQRLYDHLGDSAGTLDAELSKLAAYVGKRAEITPEDVGALTGHHREEKVFAVTDAMAAGDVAAAIRHWEQVLATDRAAPGRAIGGLAWAVRQLLDARRKWERGINVQAIPGRFFREPAALRRVLEAFSEEQLESQQRDLLEADLALKTGASTIDSAIEKFIIKHTHVARGGASGRARTAVAC